MSIKHYKKKVSFSTEKSVGKDAKSIGNEIFSTDFASVGNFQVGNDTYQ